MADGLKFYAPLNGNANDISGNSYNGTVTGATLTTDRFGIANAGYLFDAVAERITFNYAIFSASSDDSLFIPFTPTVASSSDQYIFDCFSGVRYLCYRNVNGIMEIYAGSTLIFSLIKAEVDTFWIAGRPVTIGILFSPGASKLYINGVLFKISTTNFTRNASSLTLGSRYTNVGYLNGTIEMAQIFNKTRTDADFALAHYLYNNYEGCTAESLSISGTMAIGQVLVANYTYKGVIDEGTSTFQWYRNGVAIIGAINQTYTYTIDDVGKHITFSIVPKNRLNETGRKIVYDNDKMLLYLPLKSDVNDYSANYNHFTISNTALGDYYGYWKLNGGPNDESIRNALLTATNITYGAGLFSQQCALFNGTSGYLSKTSYTTQNAQYTFCGMIYVDSLSQVRTILSHGGYGNFQIETNGKLSYEISGVSASIKFFSTDTIPLNTWVFVALRNFGKSATNENRKTWEVDMWIGIGGVLTKQTLTNQSTTLNTTMGTTLTIGCKTAGVDHFSGKMQELRMNSFCLLDDEVSAIYNSGNNILGLITYPNYIDGRYRVKGSINVVSDTVGDYQNLKFTQDNSFSYAIKVKIPLFGGFETGGFGRSAKQCVYFRPGGTKGIYDIIGGDRGASVSAISTGYIYNLNEEKTIVLSYNTITKQKKLFVNGVLIGQGGMNTIFGFAGVLYFGGPILSGNGTNANYLIKDVSVFGKTLELADAQIYNQYGALPFATGVSITGTPTKGNTLSGHYTYNGLVDEGVSKFQRYRDSFAIGGATNINYVLTDADIGKKITFGVTPYNRIAEAGAEVVAYINAEKPSISSIVIDGSVIVGNTIHSKYIYKYPEDEGATTFQRYIDGVAVPGETNEQYEIRPEDLGKMLKIGITPVNIHGGIGDETFSLATKVGIFVYKAKSYQIKVYGLDGTLKSNVNPKKIMSDISFTNQINGGQGELKLKLNLSFADISYQEGDVVQVFSYYDSFSKGKLIYTGVVSRLKRYLQGNGEFIELSCIGLFSFMNRLFYKSGTYNFTKNTDPALILEDIIHSFNAIYTYERVSHLYVNTFGTNINIGFNYKKCNEAIQDVQKATSSWFFYIGADGDLIYKDTGGILINHRVKLENQVDNMYIDEQIESATNKLFVEYSGGVVGPIEDATSQSTYGILEKKINAGDIQDVGGATLYGQQYVSQNKDLKKQIQVTVNNRYNIESINPGDTLTILNSEYELQPMLINKVQYYQDKVVLNLDRYETFAQSILSNN